MTIETARYRLMQDGIQVAAVEGAADRALAEILHYWGQYAQDGACCVEQHNGKRWTSVTVQLSRQGQPA